MSQTDAGELLQAVRAFLRQDVLPQLEGFSAYTTRVAANSLGIVARELQLAPQLQRLDAAAAAAYGLDPQAGPVGRQIALRLRDGLQEADEQLIAYLRQRTLLAMAIDNPKYAGYLQARARWQDVPTRETPR